MTAKGFMVQDQPKMGDGWALLELDRALLLRREIMGREGQIVARNVILEKE